MISEDLGKSWQLGHIFGKAPWEQWPRIQRPILSQFNQEKSFGMPVFIYQVKQLLTGCTHVLYSFVVSADLCDWLVTFISLL